MARITTKAWNNYIGILRRISDRASKEMLSMVTKLSDQYSEGIITLEEYENAAIDYAYALATRYGEAAGSAACEMYDAIAELQGANVPPAVPAPTATMDETAKAVVGTMKTGNVNIVADATGRLVKLVGVDTMQQNALRDGAEWAWIPRGDTCAFCLTLASRGWQKASKNAIRNGHAEHVHANCDCTYAVRFSDDVDVEGYHPDEYLEMYENADGNSPAARINALRREFYAENKKIINAQKRSAYTKRIERNSSAAEEFVPKNKDGKSISFDDKIASDPKFDQTRSLISSLSNEYTTRLEQVTVGAEKAAGDVDISGSRMRLNAKQISNAVHEFAHTLANSNADKYGLTNDKEFWKEIRKIYRAYHKDVDAAQDVSRWISSYEHSSRNLDEFMAEAFTHAKLAELGLEIPSKYGKDFKYSRQVLATVNKYFKR